MTASTQNKREAQTRKSLAGLGLYGLGEARREVLLLLIPKTISEHYDNTVQTDIKLLRSNGFGF